jgi:hypothetical protein
MLRNINLIRRISSKSQKEFANYIDQKINIYSDNPEFTQNQIQAWLKRSEKGKKRNMQSINNIKNKKFEIPYLNNK